MPATRSSRRLRGEADAVDLTLQSALVGTAMTGLAMPLVWTAPGGWDWVMLAGAVLQAAGQWTLAAALQRAEVAALQLWQYVKLAWALGFDLALFGLVPDPVAAAGIALILAGTALAARPGAAGR